MARVIIQAQTPGNLEKLIKLAVENQSKVISYGISKTKKKLQELEKEYGMDSKEFYDKFLKGKLGDDLKYIRWAGEYETLVLLQKDYDDLQGLELCS